MAETPQRIWDWVREVLYPVNDDIGTEKNGDYLLHYEGWGGFCVAPAGDTTRPDEENEERAHAYAEEESDAVIGAWMDKHRRTYEVVDAGYLPNAAYGLTWALFVRRKQAALRRESKVRRGAQSPRTRRTADKREQAVRMTKRGSEGRGE